MSKVWYYYLVRNYLDALKHIIVPVLAVNLFFTSILSYSEVVRFFTLLKALIFFCIVIVTPIFRLTRFDFFVHVYGFTFFRHQLENSENQCCYYGFSIIKDLSLCLYFCIPFVGLYSFFLSLSLIMHWIYPLLLGFSADMLLVYSVRSVWCN